MKFADLRKNLTAGALSFSVLACSGITTDMTSVSAIVGEFSEESFLVYTGTFGSEKYPVFEYYYPTDRISGTNYAHRKTYFKGNAPETLNYGDIFAVGGEVETTKDSTTMNTYILDENTELNCIGNCAEVMEIKTLTVTSFGYDGMPREPYFSIYTYHLADETGTDYYYSYDRYGTTHDMVMSAGEGESYTFAVYRDSAIIPVDIAEEDPESEFLRMEITRTPFDTVVHGYEELDLTGMTISVYETDADGNEKQTLEDAALDEVKEKYEVSVEIESGKPGGGTCIVTVSAYNNVLEQDVTASDSFGIAFGAPRVEGDVNGDGNFAVSDVVSLQKWLVSAPDSQLNDWKAADFCKDGQIDVFDLCMMKSSLVGGSI